MESLIPEKYFDKALKPAKGISITLFIELSIVIIALLAHGITLEALQTVTRFSGRFSLLIFSVIFLFVSPPGRIASALSSSYFLVFAVAHAIHLIELLSYIYLSGNQFNPARAAGGFIAYLVIFIMPAIHHFYQTAKLKDKIFFAFQTIYLSYVWFVFFMTYLPRVRGTMSNVGGNYWEFLVLFIWVLLLPVLKFIIFRQLKPAPKP